MKKRYITIITFVVLIMATLMCFAGCGKKTQAPVVIPTQAPAPTAAPTEAPTETPTEPAPTEPEWEPAKAKANYVEAVYGSLNKGDKVEVVGKFAHYYVISAEPYNLLVDEAYVRLDSEKAFKSYGVYSRYNVPVFESVYMKNEPIARLSVNTLLTVLEEKGGWMFVEWSGGKGYVRATDTSTGYLTTGGGSSGKKKPADGTDVNVGDLLSATEQQGGVMLLGNYHGPEMIADAQKGKGTVIAENVETYITVFKFGDEMKVIASDDETCTVYLDAGVTAKIDRAFVKLENDVEEEPFNGYIASLATAYKEYQSRTLYNQLQFNAEVQALFKLPGLYHDSEEVYAVVIDGEVMYMPVSGIMMTKYYRDDDVPAPVAPDSWTPPKL